MNEPNPEAAARLRQIREHLGETQTVFAERFGHKGNSHNAAIKGYYCEAAVG
ncbi:MAG: hypothetical protein JSU77_03600 [Fidelibacterota bacterium]|nr:MAG: hypothetical protein JSU77_03600 [Candidatus Neomarinimicrobiota bacterium]